MPVLDTIPAGTLAACPPSTGCIPTDIGYVDLVWTGDVTPVSGAPASSITGFGYYEVQRKDTDPESSTYQTIGKVADRESPHFPDYEARQRVVSTYRVRVVRDDGTEGDWSSPITGTPPVPSNAGSGVLIFTSNVDPSMSVVYGEAFQSDPVEDFGFPEADTRQLVRLYQQDFQRALRPSERGGTAFTRSLLIGHSPPPRVRVPARYGVAVYGQARYGGSEPPSADDAFTKLRDLAWADLPYVCVLDDQGNRWLANVNVLSGNVRRGKGLFLAQIVVTQVTATPSQEDAAPSFATDSGTPAAYPGGYQGGYSGS